jgi:hypothetical protein
MKTTSKAIIGALAAAALAFGATSAVGVGSHDSAATAIEYGLHVSNPTAVEYGLHVSNPTAVEY